MLIKWLGFSPTKLNTHYKIAADILMFENMLTILLSLLYLLLAVLLVRV